MRSHEPTRRAALLARPDWTPAPHAGLCGRCGATFTSGEAILAQPEGALGSRAECCADPALWRPSTTTGRHPYETRKP